MHWNFWALSALINAFCITALGLFVSLRGRGQAVKRSFAISNFSVAAWCIPYFVWQISETRESALFWARALTAGSVFIASFYLKFVYDFVGIEGRKQKLILFLSFLLSSSFFVLSFTPLFVTDVVSRSIFKFWPVPGPLYFLYPIHFFLCFCYCWRLLWEFLQKSDYARANQVKYILYGSLIGVIGGATNWPLWWNIHILPYGNLGVLIYVGIVTYAIFKHRLMDINLVFRRSIIYSIMATAITLVYFVTVWSSERVFQAAIGYRSVVATLIILLTIAFLFQPIKNKIQAFVDNRLFRGTLETLADENQRLQEEMRKSDQLRIAGTLASSIAHEINNPLTSIKTFTNYLPERHQDKSFIDKFKTVVGEELNRIEGLVKDLKDFAKPHPPKFECFDMHKFLDRTFELVNPTLATHKISLMRAYHRPNTEVMGDPSQLQQAFLNLFLNAMDAMPNGGELRISTQSEDGWLTIRIEDTGIGMTKEQLEHIFEPFYSTKEGGTGLGLAITKRIIEDHRGKVKVTSNPGSGSAFEILLPLT